MEWTSRFTKPNELVFKAEDPYRRSYLLYIILYLVFGRFVRTGSTYRCR